MQQDIWTTFWFYTDFYRDYALRRWGSITPFEYGVLLIGVGVFGWLLLRSVGRK